MDAAKSASTEIDQVPAPVVIRATQGNVQWTITLLEDAAQFTSTNLEIFVIPRTEGAAQITVVKEVMADTIVIQVDVAVDWRPHLTLTKSDYSQILEWNSHVKQGDVKRMLRGWGIFLAIAGSLISGFRIVAGLPLNMFSILAFLLGITDIVFPRREMLIVNGAYFVLSGIFNTVLAIMFQSISVGSIISSALIPFLIAWMFFRKFRATRSTA